MAPQMVFISGEVATEHYGEEHLFNIEWDDTEKSCNIYVIYTVYVGLGSFVLTIMSLTLFHHHSDLKVHCVVLGKNF